MVSLSRREFGRLVLAGTPLAVAAYSGQAAGQLTLGVSTLSFRELPRVPGQPNLNDILRVLQEVHATHIELAFANVEPAPPSTASFLGGTPAYPKRVVLTPEQVAATHVEYRAELRAWRSDTNLGEFERMGAQIAADGFSLKACTLAYDDSFTDVEIDATFDQARALGAGAISSPMTMKTARRLVPFAERHRISIAIHNQVDGNNTGLIATPELDAALALSPRFGLKLDVGNLTASNRDAVAVLSQHQPRVLQVLLKDRLRNGGGSQHFGEGDTPIAAVVNRLQTSASSIPAMVEYDYLGLRPAVDEVTASLAFVAHALAR
jgi:hypothetical protein